MKLTDEQRDELWKLSLHHSSNGLTSLQAVLDECERLLSPQQELPQWRDPVLDPPTPDDLDADGEVAVKAKDGSVFCTDPSGILEGFRWMCLVELASLPQKDYTELRMAEERRKFEAAFRGLNLSRAQAGHYDDPRTESAWLGWKLRSEAK